MADKKAMSPAKTKKAKGKMSSKERFLAMIAKQKPGAKPKRK